MSTDTDIYDAFAAKLAGYAAANSLPVAWPGMTFVPPSSGQWLECSWFPNETVNLGLAYDGPSQHRGFGQVSCCERPGSGIENVLSMAGEIMALFAKGAVLGAAQVERKPWASTVLNGADRVAVPVTIRYSGAVMN